MKTILSFSTLALAGAAGWLIAQGPLTPPGAPAPNFKTLQQIEPRTDLQATPAPPGVETSNADYHFIINQPGSYYLSANLGVTKANGVRIDAEGVTLDLNGFQISRTSGTGGDGIDILNTAHGAGVRNGSLKAFASGIAGGSALASAFRDLVITGCTGVGMVTGEGAVLESCRAHDNSGTFGIFAGNGSTLSKCAVERNTADNAAIQTGRGSTLSNCSAYANSSLFGIYVSDGSTLINCSVSTSTNASANAAGMVVSPGSLVTNCSSDHNLGRGFLLFPGATLQNCTAIGNMGRGMSAGDRCTISNCTISNNDAYGIYAGNASAVSHCTATDTTGSGIGIRVGDNSLVTGCTASGNGGDGIQLTARCQAMQNNASGNTGNGIHAFGSLNRIDGNHATGNSGAGIRSDAGDFTVRNTVNSNTGGNLVPASGGNVAPIQQASNATNPLANLQ
jgi:parallel beta-helix repeat protein